MSSHQPSRRMFTVEQANAMLPLVRAITADLVELAREVYERRQRLAVLIGKRDLSKSDPYSAELIHVQEQLQRDAERLQGFVEELRELGVEPKGALEGLVDFPSLMEGREVCLCWKLGESEVLYWHELDAGFSGRQSLTAGSVASGEDDSFGS